MRYFSLQRKLLLLETDPLFSHIATPPTIEGTLILLLTETKTSTEHNLLRQLVTQKFNMKLTSILYRVGTKKNILFCEKIR